MRQYGLTIVRKRLLASLGACDAVYVKWESLRTLLTENISALFMHCYAARNNRSFLIDRCCAPPGIQSREVVIYFKHIGDLKTVMSNNHAESWLSTQTCCDFMNAAGETPVLLPVGNEPILSFSLKALEQSDITDLIVVCAGRSTGHKVNAWLDQQYHGAVNVRVQTLLEDKGTADAFKRIAETSSADSVLVISGDTVTDINFKALLATHYHTDATVTALFTQQSSPSAVTKPGKAPKAVDFVGLDARQKRLLFLDSSREDKREVRVPLHVLKGAGHMDLGTHLRDQHLYILDRRAALVALQAKPSVTSIQKDLIPYMVRHQHRPPAALVPGESGEGLLDATSSSTGRTSSPSVSGALGPPVSLGAVAHFSHSQRPHHRQGWLCQAFLPPKKSLCLRADTLESYGEANREVAMPDRAAWFLGKAPDERTGAVMAEGVEMGHKAAVGGGSIVGALTRLGDRTSVKRSVLGPSCVLGANVKVDKCVLMEGVVVGDGVQLHSCLLGPGSHVADRCFLRDCQIGADFSVAEGTDARGETLARQSKRPDLSRISSVG